MEIANGVVSGLLALAFLGGGGTKLIGMQMHLDNFQRWGYPSWFRVAVGVLEVAAGVLVIMPHTRWIGASVIGVVMLGAVWTHVRASEWKMLAVPLGLGAMASYLAARACPYLYN